MKLSFDLQLQVFPNEEDAPHHRQEKNLQVQFSLLNR